MGWGQLRREGGGELECKVTSNDHHLSSATADQTHSQPDKFNVDSQIGESQVDSKIYETTVDRSFGCLPDIDVYVRTVTGEGSSKPFATLFGTTKLFLQAASSVFRKDPNFAVGGDTHESIPIIDIEEQSYHVQLFLLFLLPSHPDIRTERDWKLPAMFEQPADIHAVARLAKKYDAPLVLKSLLNKYLPGFYAGDHDGEYRHETAPFDAFGLALVYGSESHARAALRSFEFNKMHEPDLSASPSRKRKLPADSDDDDSVSNGGETATLSDDYPAEDRNKEHLARDFDLSHMNKDILARISMAHVAEFCRVAGLVRYWKGYTWTQAAKDFMVSAAVSLTPTSRSTYRAGLRARCGRTTSENSASSLRIRHSLPSCRPSTAPLPPAVAPHLRASFLRFSPNDPITSHASCLLPCFLPSSVCHRKHIHLSRTSSSHQLPLPTPHLNPNSLPSVGHSRSTMMLPPSSSASSSSPSP